MPDIRVANVLEEAVYGGPHKRVVLAADKLRERSIESTIVGPAAADRFRKEAEELGLSYTSVGLTALSRDPKFLARFLATAPIEVRRLSAALRSSGCDLVHVSGGAWSFKTVFACRLVGIPFVWHMNDAFQPKPVLKLFRAVAALVPPSGVLYSGVRAKNYYESYFDPSIPTGIARPPVSEALGELRREEIERPGCFQDEGPVAVLVGNVNTTKATLDAVVAAVELIERGTNLQLCLVGAVKASQDAYLRECQKAAGRHWGTRILHTGQVPDVSPFLLHADLSVCSSLSESGPMSVWESAALGCPIVSSDVGDVRAVLEPLGLTRLFEPGDRAGLRDSMGESIADADGRANAEASRAAVVAALSSDVAAEATAKVYRESVGL